MTHLELGTAHITLTSSRPMLMHRGGLANPLDPYAKAVKQLSGKRGKQEADLLELALREWRGGMYYADDIGPYLPAELLEAALIGGGKKHRLGTALRQGLQVDADRVPLLYDGPRDMAGLEAAGDAFYLDSIVKVGAAKLVRRRPKFDAWQATFTCTFDPTVVDVDSIRLSAVTAGRLIGVGDWRPRYGRFDATVEAVA